MNIKSIEAFRILIFFQFIALLRIVESTRVLVSIYLCWGWFFICDLNTSAGELLYVLQMCVCPPCCGVYVCVFLSSWLGK